MTRHSKRNTALSFFTAYERSLLKHYGRQSQRLTGDSFRQFDTCHLCLMPARDPVACRTRGHIFCRECIMENLLAQGIEIKRVKKALDRRRDDAARIKAITDEEERESRIMEFETLQSGIQTAEGRMRKRARVEEQGGRRSEVCAAAALLPATNGDAEDSKKIASFWIPSLTPAITESDSIEPPKLYPICPASASDDIHIISLKSLISVKFQLLHSSSSSSPAQRICPSCDKIFGSVLDAYLATPCGHLICKNCYGKVMKPMHAGERLECYTCQADLSGKGNGEDTLLLFLPREGTGYSAGGKAVVEKAGIAFQG
ncbi:nitric oxide synthase-interacting [Limtongia smithiae]|uniref:nitric oxide synthase-interacting n=1 Tax=Limtongia smithiae TaxID=1125753 RepID=UPI0034CF3171